MIYYLQSRMDDVLSVVSDPLDASSTGITTTK